jgi:histidine triad (HIT) family protein
MGCPFCGDLSDRTIYRDELVQVFPTNLPVVVGHVLISPIRHVEKIDDLTDAEFAAIKGQILTMKPVLTKTFAAEGFNIAWNEGEVAGQTVNHLHVHLLPRKAGDKGVYGYDPRQFFYRPGSRETEPDEELQQVAKIIKNNLG